MRRIFIITALLGCSLIGVIAQTQQREYVPPQGGMISVEHDGHGMISNDGGKTWTRLLVSTAPSELIGVTLAMQAPTKLFDVSNGNGVVSGGVTVIRGTLIWYRDDAAKTKVIDNFCSAYGYQANVPNPNAGQPGEPATIPNPQSKQAFFNKQLTAYIKDIVRGREIAAASATAGAAAGTAIDADLPNSN